MIPKDKMNEALSPFSLNISNEQLEKFNTYSKYLLEYNEKVNLTAITEPNDCNKALCG